MEEENRRLRRAVEELALLNELAREIGASLDTKGIMNTIIRRSLRAVHADQGVITLVEEKPDQAMKTLVRTMVSSGEQQPFHLDLCVLGWMHLNKRPLLIDNPRADDRFRGVNWDESIHSLLAVPLLVKSELRGVLTVYNKKGTGGFTEEDQRLLAIIAAQSAQVVESARLYEEEQALFRIREELRVASEIQLGLLPKAAPPVEGYDLAGISIPAQMVGGDYFDFIPIDENRWAICLGDVSGKGLAAALLMANLQATIRGQTRPSLTPKQCIRRSNVLLYGSTDPQKFATFFYGLLDTQKHELRYCNAGHERPFLYSEGKDPLRLGTGGMVLSFMEQFPYEEDVVPLDPGDILVIFSDGVTDAVNDLDEPFGEQRLSTLVGESLRDSAAGVIDRIVLAVQQHALDRPQMDDMTLVVIKRVKA